METPDLATVTRQLDELHARLSGVAANANPEMRGQFEALLQQLRDSQAKFTAEYQTTTEGIQQTLKEATQRAATAKEQAAAAAAAAKPTLPPFSITPPPPPPSTVDAKFGLLLRKELLQRFGKPRPDQKADPDHEIWEDWDEGTGDWK